MIMENKQPTMKKLFTYTLELWYRHGDNDKEFMEAIVIAENDDLAKELAKNSRKNIFKVEIKSKEIYIKNK